MTFNPKLITNKTDFHFTVLNQLQSIWQQYSRVKSAIERNRNTAPRVLMDVIDEFKGLGFDHLRHSNFDSFSNYVDELRRHNLNWKLEELTDQLAKLSVIGVVMKKGGTEVPSLGKRELYDAFFRFWRDATTHLIESATFTLEDQKYYAYLDERGKAEEGSILSGAARYTHILVDEFQDINPLDLNLVKAIATRNRSTVLIAGDDDQAIFEWRGSTPEYILNPDQFFGSPFSTYTLAVNYRSPANIVERSQQLIANNRRRVPKSVRAHTQELAHIEVSEIDDLDDGLSSVYGIVQETVTGGVSPARVAVIGRKRSQLIPYQVYFASKDISFCAAEDLHVFLSDTFERLLELISIKTRATFRTGGNQATTDLLKLCDLIKRYPLSKSDREGLRRHVQALGASSLGTAMEALYSYAGTLKGQNTRGKTSKAMAEAIRLFLGAKTVSETLLVLSSEFEGLHIDFGKAEDDIFYTDPPFLQLAEYAFRYGERYEDFVEDIERAKQQLVYIPPFDDENPTNGIYELWKRPVQLMTALRAKGKEFDTVVLLDVIHGIWPNSHAKTPEQLEAERRVFYVAFTRAKKNVHILTKLRVGNQMAVPSPYIKELGLP